MRRRALRIAAGLAGLVVVLLVGERVLGFAFPPPVATLESWPRSIEVVARDGRALRIAANRDGERCLARPLEAFSTPLVDALVAAEDARFFAHSGVDAAAVLRAAAANLLRGRVVSGASTLSMQLARILEPRPRTLRSKAIEAFRARQLERALGKRGVLEAYLNLAPLGGAVRGFEAAARRWFGIEAADLSPPQAAALVAMLPAPTRRSPLRDPEGLRRHRDRVLGRMRECGSLSAEAFEAARAEPLGMELHPWPFVAPHLGDAVLREARARGATGRIETALDPKLQDVAERAVLDRDLPGDAAAVVVIEFGSRDPDAASRWLLGADDQAIVALVGSRDWHASKFNAAAAAHPAGSTLKPFLYALGLARGAIAPDGLVADLPLATADWIPRNADREARGRLRAREALGQSRNLPAVRLLRELGADAFRDVLLELGLPAARSWLGLDSALGTLSVSPLALARAYARFAAVDEVPLHALDRRARAECLRMLADDRPLAGRNRPVAWKTGTSNGRRDAWCAAVTARHVVVVWLGRLDGGGDPDLTGIGAAAPVAARIVGALAGGGGAPRFATTGVADEPLAMRSVR